MPRSAVCRGIPRHLSPSSCGEAGRALRRSPHSAVRSDRESASAAPQRLARGRASTQNRRALRCRDGHHQTDLRAGVRRVRLAGRARRPRLVGASERRAGGDHRRPPRPRHGRRDRTAIHWVGADGAERRVTFGELARQSARVGNRLRRLGVNQGDRVATVLPRIPEAMPAIVGALRAGAILVPVFTGFAPEAVGLPAAAQRRQGRLRGGRVLAIWCRRSRACRW